MPTMTLWDILQNLQSPARAYQEKFGNLPPNLVKLAATIGTINLLKADLAAAVETGVPIQNWDAYRGLQRQPS